jgi:hypothetical protein
MNRHGRSLVLIGLTAMAWSIAQAQLEVGGSLLDNCAKIDGLQKAGKFTDARDAANLCLQGIEQSLQGQVQQYFKADVAGWKRKSIEQNMVLGFANVTAVYTKGETNVSVSLTRGASGDDSVGAGLGKLLGGIARAGLLETGQKVRVGGLPATVQQDGSIVVNMDGGAFLTFMSTSFKDADSALKGMGDLVDAFPVADINKSVTKK